ncbi:MAG: GNAT family N-acetyltransferase [Gammaproteobacteria bacterium]|nr:GNAT family N-acetyltransferase [Gammaproteobacteria bacterium]
MPEQALVDWIEQLAGRLQQSRQRSLLLCRGSRSWCLDVVEHCARFGQQRLLTDLEDISDGLAFSKAETLLGQEADCVVYDMFGGLQVDVLCMAAGLVRAGGILLLLVPEDYQPGDDRYGRWQGKTSQAGYFVRYLLAGFASSDAVYQLQETQPLLPIQQISDASMVDFDGAASAEQVEILQALAAWLGQTKKPLFFLTADRGRGKSTTLGMFAAAQAGQRQLVVTAASRAQAAILLQQLATPDAVAFIAPDEIIRRGERIDCLIIDEAAMLPYSLLRQCLDLADKTVLATTTGGYEGTGQGFLLRFLAAFEPQDYAHHQLFEPIRWGRQDQLETLLNQLLWLKPSLPEWACDGTKVELRVYAKPELNQNIRRLQSIYNLLISAHYRTRPSDLRQLMEDENQRVITAEVGDEVVGVMLLNREGGLDAELCHEIFMGRRRPQGHLLAQMLTAQAGIRQFARYRGYRVQRITVHPDGRRQGIGTRLIQRAQRLVAAEQLDYLGTSFALDHALAAFWSGLDFALVHIGSGQGKSTGRQTVALINSSNKQVRADVALLQHKLAQYLPLWLLTYCRLMYWQDVRALLQLAQLHYQLSELDEDDIRAFAEGHRGFDLSQGSLQKLVIMGLPRMSELTEPQCALLIDKILLNRAWQSLTGPELCGRKQLQQQLRQSILRCYEYWQNNEL